ncbi:rhodanese-like domain-containing protein [Flavobacterium sp. UBA6135]|uniref:rhodanese-like domain-containing protein n=1 Tax=Flavobacterium sp. UBA6135 TaxID=1946553 RepID=UPI0025C59E12|nr:rhodanese-like domain-containing protein [Flavobacterium sp. UBA6135]
MGLLDILGFGSKTNSIQEFKEKGAVIIDVRTVDEFKNGHITGSKNYPLGSLSSKINDIKKANKPVIVCCQSGMRSSQAASLLQKNGIEVINGGGWSSLQQKL